MKKLLVILAAVMLTLTCLTACNNGKCDECGKKAAAMTKAAQDRGLEGEFCKDCMKTIANLGK